MHPSTDMRKFATYFPGAMTCIIVLLFLIPAISIFLKYPMRLSGYSSLIESNYAAYFLLLSLMLLIINTCFYKYAKYARGLSRFNLLASACFVTAQIVFISVIYNTAKKNNITVSFSKALARPQYRNSLHATYTYCTVNNERQLLDVYLPEQTSGQPSIPVVVVHGGGFIAGNRTQDKYAHIWFTQHGYTVFSIDYPLGKKDRQTWESAPNSVATSMSFIVKNAGKFHVNPNKILLAGSSAGGALAMQTALGLLNSYVKTYDSVLVPVPAAVIAICPPVNLTEQWNKMKAGKTVDLTDAANKYLGGGPSEFPERYRQVDLIRHLSKGIPPTLIIAGDVDHVVNIEATREFINRALELKLPVNYVEIPYGEHVFDANYNSLNGQIKWGETNSFLKKYHLTN